MTAQKQNKTKIKNRLLFCLRVWFGPKKILSHERCATVAPSLQRVANQQGFLATYLPSYRHTWFQLGVCTYKQLAMAAYWSGSAMLTASQDRHKLLMNDIHSTPELQQHSLDWRCLEADRDVILKSLELLINSTLQKQPSQRNPSFKVCRD